jgi:hypothetical protein
VLDCASSVIGWVGGQRGRWEHGPALLDSSRGDRLVLALADDLGAKAIAVSDRARARLAGGLNQLPRYPRCPRRWR